MRSSRRPGVMLVLVAALALVGCGSAPPKIRVPDVAGMTAAEAIDYLVEAGLEISDHAIRTAKSLPHADMPVTGTDPGAGSLVSSRDEVHLEFPAIRVAEVIDGLTMKTERGELLRLYGIELPKGGICSPADSKLVLEKLVLGKEIFVTNPTGSAEVEDEGTIPVEISMQGLNDVGYQMILHGGAVPNGEPRGEHDVYPNGLADASCRPAVAREKVAEEAAEAEEARHREELFAEFNTRWTCAYNPTMNENWYDDVLCVRGTERHRPILREWDPFVEEWEMVEGAKAYEAHLNSKVRD